MSEEGLKEVMFNPLPIIYGEEYDKIKSSINQYKEKNVFEKIESWKTITL